MGLDPGAARERVRVARALGGLPQLAVALARGELSYSKVRALTRVATPETEARLLAVGRAGTTAHVERLVRVWRQVDREGDEAAERHRRRSLHHIQHWVNGGPTRLDNLALLCRRHHRAVHALAWAIDGLHPAAQPPGSPADRSTLRLRSGLSTHVASGPDVSP